jgi:beta-glucosidase
MENRTYRYFQGKPLYAFGHGLSYTTFQYRNAGAMVSKSDPKAVTVDLDVANTGGRDGDEVVQVYVQPPGARERLALAGFKRIHVHRAENEHVTLTIPATALRRWNDSQHDYAIPAGEWKIMIGASSSDIRHSISLRL